MSDQLRELSTAAVGLVVGIKTLSISMRRVTMRDKWGGKALEQMNTAEMAAAASATGLETRGAKDEAEVKRLLAVAEAAECAVVVEARRALVEVERELLDRVARVARPFVPRATSASTSASFS